MAPMKLEDNMKERLEERRIEPSAAAWSRIEGGLEVAHEKKKGKRYLWVGVAASFLIGAGLMFFILNNESDQGDNRFVDVEELTTPEIDPGASEEAFPMEDRISDQNNGLTEAPAAPKESSAATNKRSPEEKSEKKRVRTRMNPSLLVQQKSDRAVVDNNTIRQDALKETQVTSEIPSITSASAGVSESELNDEVEALLQKALAKTASAKIFDKGQYFVDAENLLLDAEAVVDPETFKDKIFKNLKLGIEEVVEAVADRNN